MTPDFPFFGRWKWCTLCDGPIIACLDPECEGASCNGFSCEKCSLEFEQVHKLFEQNEQPTYEELTDQPGFRHFQDIIPTGGRLERLNRWGRKGNHFNGKNHFLMDNKFYIAWVNHHQYHHGREYKGNGVWKDLEYTDENKKDDKPFGAVAEVQNIMANGRCISDSTELERMLSEWDDKRNATLQD